MEPLGVNPASANVRPPAFVQNRRKNLKMTVAPKLSEPSSYSLLTKSSDKVAQPEASQTVNEEERFFKIVGQIEKKVSPDELTPFLKLCSGESASQDLIQEAQVNLAAIAKRCTREEKDVLITLMFHLAEGKEDLLFQVMEGLPDRQSFLAPEIPLVSAFAQPKETLSDSRRYLAHLGYEPLNAEVEKLKRLFSKLTPEMKGEILTNIHTFLIRFQDQIKQAQGEKFTPLDLVHLNLLAHHIEGLYQGESDWDPLRKEVLQQVIQCQTNILEKVSVHKRELFARTIHEWSLMEQLREQIFPVLYTQVRAAAPQAVEGIKTQKSWHTTQEQLLYLIHRAKQVKAQDRSKTQVMDKIIERAEKKLHALKLGQPVKMPAYYHMTKEVALIKVLKGTVEVRTATEGKGAYISSRMETDYGTFGLVFDRYDVEEKELSTDSTVNQSKFWSVQEQPTWRALKRSIHVMVTEGSKNPKLNLVYLVADPLLGIEGTKKILKEQGLDHLVDIVGYDEARYEEQFLKELRGTYEPRHWSSFWQTQGTTQMHDMFSKALQIMQKKSGPDKEEEDNAWE